VKVLIVAGEVSGDKHGAGVVRALRELNPSLEIFGIGGNTMEEAGMELLRHIQELNFMGFVEVLKHLPKIREVEKQLETVLEIRKPEVVLLIDYPGFNLRLAKKAKASGARVLYYISPQVWAWKKKRIKKMKRIIDTMCVVFPFEVELYEREGINVEFVGHPLLEEIPEQKTKEEFCYQHRIDSSKQIVGLFPGSRKQEVDKIFPSMLEAGKMLQREMNVEIAIGVAPHIERERLLSILPNDVEVNLIENDTYGLMNHCDLAIVTSGTATLETALFETPMVVVYKTSAATYQIAKMLVRINFIGLVNIVAGKKIVPELIQHEASSENIYSHAKEILENFLLQNEMKKNLSRVRQSLGTSGASQRVAEKILETWN